MPLEFVFSPMFWGAAAQIVLIDLLLGGDNAVIIALASRNLPLDQRRRAIIWGTVGAVGLRIILTIFAVGLLELPWLKLVGAALLLVIGVKLMQPEDEHADITPADRLWVAVRTVIVADLVMSLDNVVAIAGAARNAGTGHEWLLVAFGLALSVPIIVWGSALVIRLLGRFPVLVVLGAMLLGWIAGNLAIEDPVLHARLDTWAAGDAVRLAAPVITTLGVWLVGSAMRQRALGGKKSRPNPDA